MTEMTRAHRWLLPLSGAALLASLAFFVAWGNRWSVARNFADDQALLLSQQSQLASQRYAIVAVVLLVTASTGFAIWVRGRNVPAVPEG